MKKLLTLLAAAAMAVGAQAGAPEVTKDFGELELNHPYDLSGYAFKSVGGTFKATESGEVKVSNGDFNVIYVNEEWSDPLYPEGGHGYTFAVEAGSSYYLYCSFLMTASIPLELTMVGPLAVTDITPAQGAVFPVTGYTNCDIVFNKEVKFSSPTITAGGVTKPLTARLANNGTQISIEVGDVLLDLMSQKVVKAGDEFIITVSNVKSGDEILGDNGKLEIAYTVPAEPTRCVDTSAPAKFLSYWMPGNQQAVLSLSFDGELDSTKGTCRLMAGTNLEEGPVYIEELPLAFNGNSVSVDFAGKDRSLGAMGLTAADMGTMNVTISGVCGLNGDAVIYDDNSTSKTFNFPYEEVPSADVVSSFTPKNGGTLVGADNIEVYIQGLKAIQFDGFKFTTAAGDVVVPMDKVTVEMGEDDDATYVVPIPASVTKGQAVQLTLNNLLSVDGKNRDKQLSAKYDTFVVMKADPKDGAELYALNADQKVTITANMQGMYVQATLTDMDAENADDAIMRSMITMVPQEDGSYVWEVPAKITLYANHDYRLGFEAWSNEDDSHYSDPVGADYVTYVGQTAAYKFSDTMFTGIDPDPAQPLEVGQRVFTAKFDGLVSLKNGSTNNDCFIVIGMGATQEFESVEPVSSDGGFANEWKLTVPESYFKADRNDLTVVINAFDPQGLRVKGNTGSEDTSCLRFEYTINKAAQTCDIIVTPAAGAVTSLSEFTVTAENGQPVGPSWTAGAAAVYTKTMDLVATVDSVAPQVDGSCLLVLDAEVTTPGNYVLVIPEGYFLIGEQFSTWSNNAANVAYTIAGDEPTPQPGVNVVCDPADGSSLNELSQIIITFADYDEASIGSGKPSMTVDGQAAEIADADFYWEGDFNQMLQSFSPALTQSGKYVITYPAGYFTLGAQGEECPEFTLTYYIGQVGITGIGADAQGMYNVYDLRGVRVLSTPDASALSTLANGFYIINGQKVVIRK